MQKKFFGPGQPIVAADLWDINKTEETYTELK